MSRERSGETLSRYMSVIRPSSRTIVHAQNQSLSPLSNRKGSALIITVLLITILTGLVMDFVYDVYIDSSSLSNWGNAQKASLIAESGQTLAALFIEEVSENSFTDTREVNLPVDHNFGRDIQLTVVIEDENAKFNINSIILPNGVTDEEALAILKKLLEYLNINPDLSLFIADWIDPDSEPRLADSEYISKNAPLWSADELALIEGFDSNTFEKIRPYITVYKNINSLVSQVNINTAQLPVLLSLHRDMTESLAGQIIDYRETTPFESASAIVSVSGLETIGVDILNSITVQSSNFRVVSQATVDEIMRVTESVIDTSLKIHFWREG